MGIRNKKMPRVGFMEPKCNHVVLPTSGDGAPGQYKSSYGLHDISCLDLLQLKFPWARKYLIMMILFFETVCFDSKRQLLMN